MPKIWKFKRGVGGTGVADQVAYWKDEVTITGEADFVYDPTDNCMQIGGAPALTNVGTKLILKNDANAADNSILHIQSGDSGHAIIYFYDTGLTFAGSIDYDNATDDLTISATDDILITPGTGDDVYIVGTAASKFQVQSQSAGTASALDVFRIRRTCTGGDPADGFEVNIGFYTKGTSQAETKIGEIVCERAGAANTSDIILRPYSAGVAKDVVWVDGSTERVGINVSAPNEDLEVAGKIRTNDVFNVSGTDGVTQIWLVQAGDVVTVTGGIITNILSAP